MSDPVLLDAFRRQCINFGPGLALLAWRGQDGVDDDDLIDIVKEFDRTRPTTGDRMTIQELADALAWLERHGHSVCIWDDDEQQFVPSLRPNALLAQDYVKRAAEDTLEA